jgi:signal transduction histidine kinase
MSHELRTPLNAILGYSEMLLEDARDAGQQSMAADLTKIQVAGKHLLGLISDILDLAKIEAGKMELHCDEFQMKDLLAEVASTVEPLLAKNGNSLKMEDVSNLGQMRTDMTRLRQTLLNLLGNAAKFTTQGRVRLAGARERRNDRDWVILRISDTGIGMNADQLARLFQDFSQGDASTTRKYGGTGLGLSISKRFCNMMGGDLYATSEMGVGSVFTVELPAEIDSAPSTAGATNLPDTLAA